MSGEAVELTIDALAAGGDGVGRAPSGLVVFVPFTAPGDRVRVELIDVRSRFARGRVATLIEPGPNRTDPLCSHFGTCGGCTWQHVAYAAQLEAKARILADALARIAHLELPGPVEITPSPGPYGYRGRTRVQVRGGRVGYRRRRSHKLCPVRRCPVLVPELDGELARLADAPPPGDCEVELAAGAGETRAVPLPVQDGPRLSLYVGADRVGFSPGVFMQSNPLLVGPLAAAVQQAAGEGRLLLELFAGAGLLTLGLARRFARLIAVESDPRSVSDLRANLEESDAVNVEVRCETVEATLSRAPGPGEAPDAVVLDPPRVGLHAGGADALARLGAARIVYVSCEPSTLARDLGVLVDRGYALRRLRGFDLFPQTPHVEALALLERGPGTT